MSPKQNRPAPGNPAPEYGATHLESDEELRQALEARRARIAARAKKAPTGPQVKAPTSAPQVEPAEVEAQLERPVLRPPGALVCVLDDAKADGEWVRLRADTTLIGRTEGDIRIPHDGLISSRHAQLVRQRTQNGGYRWVLIDLQSTNGTFVRISNTLLRHDNEVLVGGGHYRFAAAATPAVEQAGAVPQTTVAWTTPVTGLVPALIEVTQAGPVKRFSLSLPEYWIGRDDKSCVIARPDDVHVNARHARLYRDEKGQWHIENNKSLNGLWLRIVEPMPVGHACQFRVGEQRFLFRAL